MNADGTRSEEAFYQRALKLAYILKSPRTMCERTEVICGRWIMLSMPHVTSFYKGINCSAVSKRHA